MGVDRRAGLLAFIDSAAGACSTCLPRTPISRPGFVKRMSPGYQCAERSRVIAAEIHVRDAFLAALMLTGTIEAAEQSVSGAIATLGCGVAVDELLVATAEVRNSNPRWLFAGAGDTLQSACRAWRLFLLSSVGRKCFVLRVLMGLTLEMTSGILNLQKDEVDEALCRALSDLPGLAGIR